MKDCQATRDTLALRSGDWSADERHRVEDHLAMCADCAALARVYAEQDRLIRSAPPVRLTPQQRDQLLSRAQRERRRHQMRTTFSTVVAAAALIVLAIGLYGLFGGGDQPTVTTPSITEQAPAASAISVPPEPPVFAAEIHLDELILELPLGKPITVTLSASDPVDPVVLGRLYVPADLRLALDWELLAPPSANWQVFLHLMNETGELVSQRDTAVDWSAQTCPTGETGLPCTVTAEHEWAFPADLMPGLYTILVGLYDPETGARAPVTDPAGTTPPQVEVGRVEVLEPFVFAGEIRIDAFVLDPWRGELLPFTLGERDPEDPFSPGRLQVPADVRFALDWGVLAPPSVDWQVFVHLMNEAGELILQSDVAVDWSEQVCDQGERGMACTVTTQHEWAFPADLPAGVYTVVVGLYDPGTGERAPVTLPQGTPTPYVLLGRVRVISDD
jgi:hypothetical protein